MSNFQLSSSLRSISSIFPLPPSSNLPLPSHYKNPFTVRASSSSLPFTPQKAKYHKELEAAVDVVTRACRICVDVQKTLFSKDGSIFEKNDNTPVTVADFSVQALISLELKNLFPSIPLVAEEDSAFLRSNNLADAVVKAVNDSSSSACKQLTDEEVLEAIDRGANKVFGAESATYWLLDPIDGTKGFLKGGSALYVVGLALIVEGEIVLSVMGCPKWHEKFSEDVQKTQAESGILMIAHVGCGTWTARLSCLLDGMMSMGVNFWERCFVKECSLVHEAHFCIPESRTWDSLPLSDSFVATTNATNPGTNQVILLSACCGSLCKYLIVASGKAHVFINPPKAQTNFKSWDHVVGMICVHEAGGKVTDWRGSQLDLAADKVARRVIFPSGGVLVTNGDLHVPIVELLSSNASVLS